MSRFLYPRASALLEKQRNVLRFAGGGGLVQCRGRGTDKSHGEQCTDAADQSIHREPPDFEMTRRMLAAGSSVARSTENG